MLILCTHDVWTEKIWPEIRLPKAEATTFQENISHNPRLVFVLLLNKVLGA